MFSQLRRPGLLIGWNKETWVTAAGGVEGGGPSGLATYHPGRTQRNSSLPGVIGSSRSPTGNAGVLSFCDREADEKMVLAFEAHNWLGFVPVL